MRPLKMIVNEEFPYLLDLLPNVYEANGFMHLLDANKSYKDLNKGPNEGPSNIQKIPSMENLVMG